MAEHLRACSDLIKGSLSQALVRNSPFICFFGRNFPAGLFIYFISKIGGFHATGTIAIVGRSLFRPLTSSIPLITSAGVDFGKNRRNESKVASAEFSPSSIPIATLIPSPTTVPYSLPFYYSPPLFCSPRRPSRISSSPPFSHTLLFPFFSLPLLH